MQPSIGPVAPPGRALLFLFLSIKLAACGEPSGDTPEVFPPPPTGTYSQSGPVKIQILGFRVAEQLELGFAVMDQEGQPLAGLSDGELGFTLARLESGQRGVGDIWRSYIQVLDQPNGQGDGASPRWQAALDPGGVLEEGPDGEYRYRYGTPLDGSGPRGLRFEPGLTHRIGIEARVEGLGAGNATWTGRMDETAGQRFREHEVVTVDSCNSCHHRLQAHAGVRSDLRYCVTCHTADSVDADSGRPLDFKVLIHLLHRGGDLAAVQAGQRLRYWDEDDNAFDFSTVRYPQEIQNCTSCHQASTPVVPQGAYWQTRPSRAACGSCHDDVDFASGRGHADGLAAGDEECALCHRDGGVAGGVALSHRSKQQRSAAFALQILELRDTAPGGRPVMRLRVVNPLHGDSPYDLRRDPAWTAASSELRVVLAWDTRDFHNTGSGQLPAQAIEFDALDLLIDAGPGEYLVFSPQALPLTAQGSGVAALTGRAVADIDGDSRHTDPLAIAAALRPFAITDQTPQARREVVSRERCDSCHGSLNAHDGRRNGDPQLCALCHNPNATDIAGRPADATRTPDGKAEESLDFKTLIHAIHDAEHNRLPSSVTDYIIPPPGPLEPRPHLYIYDRQGQVHEFGDLRYPGVLGNCAACHEDDSYLLPLPTQVLATTIDTGDNLEDPNDDTNITRSKAVCLSCHYWQGDHMDTEGLSSSNARYPLVDAGLDTEQCFNCHGPGAMADVGQLHPIIR